MPRLHPDEIVISPVAEEDLPSIAVGSYKALGTDLFDLLEPQDKRPSQEVREKRFAERMKPWLTDPNIKCSKATLANDTSKPPRVIGHTAWLVPQPEGVHGMHYWRSDSYKGRGYQEKFGISDGQLKEWWEHVDVPAWDGLFSKYDNQREELMKDEPHWFLAPVWVLPEYQGRGLGSLLIKEVSDIADAQDPPIPLFLESSPSAMAFYPKLGFELIQFPPDDEHDEPYTAEQMIRRGPQKKAKKLVD